MPAKRTGIMKLDSSRCMGGAEITTYDSLDASMGQSRNNLYLGVKTWASYVLLESLLKQCGKTDAAKRAGIQADKCSATIVAQASPEGYIPAIEGLVFPFIAGCKEAVDPAGRFGALIIALKKHTEFVLKPGICLFDNDVWKMSSTSVNSWPSKIYLCQFIVRKILGLHGDTYSSKADKAHAAPGYLYSVAAGVTFTDIFLITSIQPRSYSRGCFCIHHLTTQNPPIRCMNRQRFLLAFVIIEHHQLTAALYL